MTAIEIKARENGPYKFPGTYTFIDENGQVQVSTGTAMALCRCGHSANKPFCDGAHRQSGFEAPLMFIKFTSGESKPK